MTHAEGPLTAAEKLYDLLASSDDLTEFLNSLAELSAAEVGPAGTCLCAVVMRRHKRNVVVGFSSDEARRMEETQAGFDEGPCLHAQETETLLHIPDVRYETRWPEYMSIVRQTQTRSVIAVPLTLKGVGAAAMNLYTSDPEGFSDEDIAQARRHGQLASRVLTVAARIARESEVARDRRYAMESRTVIDVAVGVIMAQNRCSQAEAFGVLQQASSNRNIKVRDLAQELVAAIGQSEPSTAFED